MNAPPDPRAADPAGTAVDYRAREALALEDRSIDELALIERLTAGFPRSPLQRNGLQEADAELLALPGGGILAVTTDALVEEIRAGIALEPYDIGWTAVMICASDLAAVGADPLGVMLCETLPPDCGDAFLEALQRGIGDACAACGMPVLGGDTNTDDRLALSCTALGLIPDGRPLLRRGAAAGDRLLLTGPVGAGNAAALAALSGAARPAALRLPRARLAEGRLLRALASACIDTSDGVVAAADQLARVNGLGFTLRGDEAVLHPAARRLAEASALPPWMLLAGPVGEYELLAAVPPRRVPALLAAARSQGWEPVDAGTLDAGRGARISIDGRPAAVDAARIRNCATLGGGDPRAVLRAVIAACSGAPAQGFSNQA